MKRETGHIEGEYPHIKDDDLHKALAGAAEEIAELKKERARYKKAVEQVRKLKRLQWRKDASDIRHLEAVLDDLGSSGKVICYLPSPSGDTRGYWKMYYVPHTDGESRQDGGILMEWQGGDDDPLVAGGTFTRALRLCPALFIRKAMPHLPELLHSAIDEAREFLHGDGNDPLPHSGQEALEK